MIEGANISDGLQKCAEKCPQHNQRRPAVMPHSVNHRGHNQDMKSCVLMFVVAQCPLELRQPDSTLGTDFFRCDVYSNSEHHIVLAPGAMQMAIQPRLASNHVGVLSNLQHAYRKPLLISFTTFARDL